MTDYQLKVLRALNVYQHQTDLSRKIHGYANGNTYTALRALAAAGLVSNSNQDRRPLWWHRTPAGDAALENADRRVIPKEPIEARLF